MTIATLRTVLTLSWTFGNQKLGKMGDAIGWGITASECNCPAAGVCKRLCYAMRGNFLYPSVRDARERNSFMSRMPGFGDLLVSDLGQIVEAMPWVRKIRVHDSGDFHSQAYFDAWMEAARAYPELRFYAYTKMFARLDMSNVPANFTVIQSAGGLDDSAIDTGRPHAVIFATTADAVAAGYADGTHDDNVAADGTIRIGLSIEAHKQRVGDSVLQGMADSRKALGIN